MACTKRRYRDKTAALYALAMAPNRKRATDKDECRAYFHAVCRAWHLTSQPKNRRGRNQPKPAPPLP